MRRVRNIVLGIAVEVAFAALMILGGYLVSALFCTFFKPQ